MRPSSWERFRVNSPRPAYEANTHNVNEGMTHQSVSNDNNTRKNCEIFHLDHFIDQKKYSFI